jgi:glycosyltransferase involved in cell wall biosynthesis
VTPVQEVDAIERRPDPDVEVAVLTGGGDKPYAFGLATALMSIGVVLDLIASDELDAPEFHNRSNVTFLNLRGSQETSAGVVTKIRRVLAYYLRLVRYAATARPRVFHILWNNKFDLIDRTVLMLYYRILGKKIAFTVHNVNAGRRDSTDSALNRLTLKIQYHLADQLFVHTEQMKAELGRDFGVRDSAITVIPFGINNAVPHTSLTFAEARQRLGIAGDEKVLLFFGNIAPYKGLEYLVRAFQQLATESPAYRLIIAGRAKESDDYWSSIDKTIGAAERERIVQRIEYIPDEETEVYFKAADVLVLPYSEIFQSGVLFLGYSFGLPVIAADVGSLGDDVIEGQTGFLFQPRDSVDLARAIRTYFLSDLFKGLTSRRPEIRDYATARYSWETVGQITRNVYLELLRDQRQAQSSRVAT